MTHKFIDRMIEDARREYHWQPPQGLQATKKAIVENASKSIQADVTKDRVAEKLGKEGKMTSCPPGYKWSTKRKRCEPRTQADSVSGSNSRDSHPDNGPSFNVWGRTGIDGDGYAWAEPGGWGGGDVSGGALGGLGESATKAQKRRRVKAKMCLRCLKKGVECICDRSTYAGTRGNYGLSHWGGLDPDNDSDGDGGDGGGDGGGE
jgi:hypothetical protein